MKFPNRKKSKFISIDPSKCEACWKCIDNCPCKVIGKVKILWHKHIIIRKAEDCIGCGKCIRSCPNNVFCKI